MLQEETLKSARHAYFSVLFVYLKENGMKVYCKHYNQNVPAVSSFLLACIDERKRAEVLQM